MEKNTKKEIFRTIKYTLIAISAGLIQIGSFTILNELIFGEGYYWLSYLISLVLSVLWNFTINRRYTFKSASNVAKAMLLVILYYCVFTPLSTWFEDFSTVQLNWNEYLSFAVNIFVNFVTEFLFMRLVVFGKSVDTNDIAEKERIKEENEENKK